VESLPLVARALALVMRVTSLIVRAVPLVMRALQLQARAWPLVMRALPLIVSTWRIMVASTQTTRAQPRIMGVSADKDGLVADNEGVAAASAPGLGGLPADAVPGGSRFSVGSAREIMPFVNANPCRHPVPLCHSPSHACTRSRRSCPGTLLGPIRGESGLPGTRSENAYFVWL
jgi:hypothetical protein